jgi:hypothetical protein
MAGLEGEFTLQERLTQLNVRLASTPPDRSVAISAEEMQVIFDVAEIELPEELKARYPIRTYNQIFQQHPSEWVGVRITHSVSPENLFLAGRVFAHDRKYETFSEQIRTLKSQNPVLKGTLTEIFTGK